MIIHSKFKDYYDSALAHGVDTSVHWVRNTSEKTIINRNVGYYADSRPPNMHPFFESSQVEDAPSPKIGDGINAITVIIGFCGKTYTGISLTYYRRVNEEVTATAFSADQILKILKDYDSYHTGKDAAKTFVKPYKKNKDGWRYMSLHTNWRYEYCESYFNRFNGNDSHASMFIDEDTPIWAIIDGGYRSRNRKESKLIVNPRLDDYDFVKVFDPYTAMQEIEMFRSGVLGNSNPDIIEIDDKYKIPGHGFDECSFRKAPTKHKGKCNKKG